MTGNVTDKLVSNAQSFQQMLVAAESTDPVFAKALLGNVTSPTKTQGGALLMGAITWISAHYGLGWSVDTVTIVSGGIMYISGALLHWWQIYLYRNSLPIPKKAVVEFPPLPIPSLRQSPAVIPTPPPAPPPAHP